MSQNSVHVVCTRPQRESDMAIPNLIQLGLALKKSIWYPPTDIIFRKNIRTRRTYDMALKDDTHKIEREKF